jgi:hypothetical protein
MWQVDPPPLASSVPTLSAESRIEVWESTAGAHPIDQAIAILRAALPGWGAEELAHLPLGERDTLLLAIRQATIGDRLDTVYSCPSCSETLELEVSCSTLLSGCNPASEPWEVVIAGYRLQLRPLDSVDAAAAAASDTAAAAAAVLLERAVVTADHGGNVVAAADLPASVVDGVSESLAEHDPAAEFLLACVCPACGHSWAELLDVAPFIAAELTASGRRVLSDIDVIARAYGWSEGEILSLGEARRRTYAELAGAGYGP